MFWTNLYLAKSKTYLTLATPTLLEPSRPLLFRGSIPASGVSLTEGVTDSTLLQHQTMDRTGSFKCQGTLHSSEPFLV